MTRNKPGFFQSLAHAAGALRARFWQAVTALPLVRGTPWAAAVRTGLHLTGYLPTKDRVVGFYSTSVQGSCSASVAVEAPAGFILERFVVPSNVAPDFLVLNLKVNGKSIFESTGPLPAVIFSETASGMSVGADPVSPKCLQVVVTVSNQATTYRNFTAALIGRVPL